MVDWVSLTTVGAVLLMRIWSQERWWLWLGIKRLFNETCKTPETFTRNVCVFDSVCGRGGGMRGYSRSTQTQSAKICPKVHFQKGGGGVLHTNIPQILEYFEHKFSPLELATASQIVSHTLCMWRLLITKYRNCHHHHSNWYNTDTMSEFYCPCNACFTVMNRRSARFDTIID